MAFWGDLKRIELKVTHSRPSCDGVIDIYRIFCRPRILASLPKIIQDTNIITVNTYQKSPMFAFFPLSKSQFSTCPRQRAIRVRKNSRMQISDILSLDATCIIAGLQVTSRRPCWGSKTKAFPSAGNKLYFDANFAKKFLLY